MKRKLIILAIILTLLLLTAAQKPIIWKVDCAGCGDCVKTCPVGAISVVDGKAVIDHNKCINCKLCIPVCKFKAIR